MNEIYFSQAAGLCECECVCVRVCTLPSEVILFSKRFCLLQRSCVFLELKIIRRGCDGDEV